MNLCKKFFLGVLLTSTSVFAQEISVNKTPEQQIQTMFQDMGVTLPEGAIGRQVSEEDVLAITVSLMAATPLFITFSTYYEKFQAEPHLVCKNCRYNFTLLDFIQELLGKLLQQATKGIATDEVDGFNKTKEVVGVFENLLVKQNQGDIAVFMVGNANCSQCTGELITS